MGKKNNLDQCKTSAELLRYATTHGGQIARQSGSHVIVKGPTGGICPIPNHPGDLATGTRCSIAKTLKAIGIIIILLLCLALYMPMVM
jgi:predicted RNA binding protein YcfA (HicA-like mRNA interferase family)